MTRSSLLHFGCDFLFLYKYDVLVHHQETVGLKYLIDLLVEKGKAAMLVGNAGIGKNILVSKELSKLTENYIVIKGPFNISHAPA